MSYGKICGGVDCFAMGSIWPAADVNTVKYNVTDRTVRFLFLDLPPFRRQHLVEFSDLVWRFYIGWKRVGSNVIRKSSTKVHLCVFVI